MLLYNYTFIYLFGYFRFRSLLLFLSHLWFAMAGPPNLTIYDTVQSIYDYVAREQLQKYKIREDRLHSW